MKWYLVVDDICAALLPTVNFPLIAPGGLCWLVTMKASHFQDNFNPSALGVVDYSNFAPATIYADFSVCHPKRPSKRASG
jgi:hypothetical protein